MIIDARSVPNGTLVECDICIVGGGAAGITLALEWIASGSRVVLLESGAMDFDPDTQALYAGESIGRPIPDPSTTRLRFFGGTTNHWGGWCRPFDTVDFEERPGIPLTGWPFDRDYLMPWYRRAQPVCQLGALDYEPATWAIKQSSIPAPFAGPDFVVKMVQESPPTRFGNVYAGELRQAANVTVYLNANALYFATNDEGTEVDRVPVRTLSGVAFAVKARFYVVATGGIENARLLLLSGRSMGAGLGSSRNMIGRCFMAHICYFAGIIALSDPYSDFSFYTGRDGLPRTVAGIDRKFVTYIGLSEETIRAQALPGTMFYWTFNFAPVLGAVEAAKRLFTGKDRGEEALRSDAAAVFRNLDGLATFAARKALYHEGVPVESFNPAITTEQLPNPDSRIELGTELDPLGLPHVAVDWQLRSEEKRKALTTHRLLAAALGRTGFGRLQSRLSDDASTWPDDMVGNQHHAGTTRMHRDPTQGVVDENCRVHGVSNLHVAGGSVFPTCGSSNPTLTIVALAIRLADHLKHRLS